MTTVTCKVVGVECWCLWLMCWHLCYLCRLPESFTQLRCLVHVGLSEILLSRLPMDIGRLERSPLVMSLLQFLECIGKGVGSPIICWPIRYFIKPHNITMPLSSVQLRLCAGSWANRVAGWLAIIIDCAFFVKEPCLCNYCNNKYERYCGPGRECVQQL